MIDNLIGGDDDEDPDESSADSEMDGGLFDGAEGGDDMMGGGGDDLMGGDDDLMGGGDEMAFDEMDEGGTATSAEMDNRIDELENEVASLSSTVNTVKSENEQISESVEDVEENIRKLLEVYEMVTRGVNPFVDESEMGNVFGDAPGGADGGGGSMGLFGDGESEGADDSEVDDSVANADAEEFFDDDFDEFEDEAEDDFEDFDEDEDEDDFDDFGDDGFEDDDFGDDGFEDDDFGDDDDGGGFDDFGDDDFEDGGFEDGSEDEEADDSGGKSFEELKAEYESGEADWDDDNGSSIDESAEEDPLEEQTDEDPIEEQTDEDPIEEQVTEDSLGENDEFGDEETFVEPEPTAETGVEPTGGETEAESRTQAPVEKGKPYLETLPSGYVADIVVMDWLEFLVEEAGIDGAARTIAYYEAIEWIDEPAAETLQTFLNGFGGDVEDDPEPRSSLTVSHHNTSLRFISRIVNPDMEMVSLESGAVPERPRSGHDSHRRGEERGVRPRNGGRSDVSLRGHEGVSDMPQGAHEIEPDGGRALSGRRRDDHAPGEEDETAVEAFDWGEDRTE